MPLGIVAALAVALLLLVRTDRLAAADAPADAPALVAPTEALPAQQQAKMFHLPPGFEIQLVAAEPDIRKPMNLAFDARGRLLATQSEEYPFPAADGAPRRDAVKLFEEFGDDGRARRVTMLVEGLNIPIGLLPTRDGIIYYSIPDIHRATGDADAPYREHRVLYSRFGFQDTHGMASSFTRWIDGWIYACHGFSNTSEVKGADGQPVTMQSGNTYRFREDGSHVEQFTHGQVNPFGLAFDPLGNLYSADCHTKPLYLLLRGAWYPSFGKPHDGLGFGPEMIEHFHGSTGIAGVVYYAADHFPPAYRDTVLIGNPVTGRVNHDRLEAHGSTYKAIELPDFLRCDDPWFRPVDIKLGPDGALYIADFYNCIIGHYEVPLTHPRRDRSLGRIWRVVYRGPGAAPHRPPPDLTRLRAAELIERLADPNLAVRVLATEELTRHVDARGTADALARIVADIRAGEPAAWQRAHALWLLERRGTQALSDMTISRLASDTERLVRVHLVKALAERPDWRATDLDLFVVVRDLLADPDPFVRRAAADALGRHPDPANVAPLLELWRTTLADDANLIHVARMALRDQLRVDGMYERLAEALAAQPDDAGRIAEVSLGVRTPAAAAFLLGYVEEHPKADALRADMLHDVALHLAVDRLAALWRHVEGYHDAPATKQRAVLVALARASQERGMPLAPELAAWGARLAERLLSAAAVAEVREGIDLARELRIEQVHDSLLALAARGTKFPDLRAAAIDACVANDAARSVAPLIAIVASPDDAMPVRQKAASALAAANQPVARAALAEQLRTAPEQLALEIARGLARGRDGGEALLAAVEAGRASPRLLQDATVERHLFGSKLEGAAERMARLTADLPPADERIKELIAARRQGFSQSRASALAGRAVFAKHCAACHRVGNDGAKIGPGLDGVGLRGVERLLEDTLDPSRNVDQAFRGSTIVTKDGRIVSGLLLREEGPVLVLADSQGKEVRVLADEVEERSQGKLSPMPANVQDLIPEGDFYHLLAFLLEQRQATTEGR